MKKDYTKKHNAYHILNFNDFSVTTMDDFIDSVKSHKDVIYPFSNKEVTVMCISISKEEMKKVTEGSEYSPTTLGGFIDQDFNGKCHGFLFIVHDEYAIEISKELIQFFIYHEIAHILNVPKLTKKETAMEVETLADLKAIEMLGWDRFIIEKTFNEWCDAVEKTYSSQNITNILKNRLEKCVYAKSEIL